MVKYAESEMSKIGELIALLALPFVRLCKLNSRLMLSIKSHDVQTAFDIFLEFIQSISEMMIVINLYTRRLCPNFDMFMVYIISYYTYEYVRLYGDASLFLYCATHRANSEQLLYETHTHTRQRKKKYFVGRNCAK